MCSRKENGCLSDQESAPITANQLQETFYRLAAANDSEEDRCPHKITSAT